MTMMDVPANQFHEKMKLVRTGDAHAISNFVSVSEPFIRRTMRFPLARASLQAAADSVDVSQSVFGSLLIRLVAGEYEIASEQDLNKLLYSIATNKFLALQRRELAMRRDRRQTVSLDQCVEIAHNRQLSPERTSSITELLGKFEFSLELDEQQLYRLRKQGLSWCAIGEQLNESPIVLRKRLSRAVKRVALELGIDSGTKGSATVRPL